MSEAPVDKCIHCGATAERQLSAGGGLLFKGSGFYITDYRSDGYKKAAEADKGGSTSKPDAGGSKDAPAGAKSTGTPKPESGKSESGKSESGKSKSGKKGSGSE